MASQEFEEVVVTPDVLMILDKLSSINLSSTEISRGIRDELTKLQHNLEENILPFAEVAEKQQHKERAIAVWLRTLKDVAYDVDDVLDEVSFQDFCRLPSDTCTMQKVRRVFSFSNPLAFQSKMCRKLMRFNRKLDEIPINDKIKFVDFNQSRLPVITKIPPRQRGRLNKSLVAVEDSVFVGRDSAKTDILRMLLRTNSPPSSSGNHDQYAKIPVIPIMGMGGLGKSILAQLAYSDDSVKKHFELRIWVCVSSDFDLPSILGHILGTAHYEDVADFKLLVHRVQEKLSGKRYVLVLDDLWSTDVEKWGKIMSCVAVGAEGSKILVTTRVYEVAQIIQAEARNYYRLKPLSMEDCWIIMKRRAFAPGSGVLETEKMTSIGREIAEKCDGLPLAAVIFGNVMRLRTTENDWLSILNNIWIPLETNTTIVPLLKFSYDNLAPHLKQCFLYCSLFPKGHKIHRESLIQLWMAEGFLGQPDKEKEVSLESIGNQYFNILWGNSLLKDVEKDEFGRIVRCTMHDLVHHLAQSVSENKEYSIVEATEIGNDSEVRRLRLVSDDNMSAAFPKSLNGNKLRTIVGFRANKCNKVASVFSNKKLRVLEVTGSCIEKLPASVSELIHIRYLDLSHGFYESLSSSFSSLHNLQTLVLRGCHLLWELPSDIGSLKNLRYLDLSYTAIQFLPASSIHLCNLRTLILSYSKLVQLPSDVGALKQLRHLDVSATKLKELPNSVSELYNLEILNFAFCPFLKVLPEDISELADLKHFISNMRMTRTPTGVGKLKSLQTLQHFIVREDITAGGGIADLGGLKLLQGELKICKLENVTDAEDAKEANLNEKQHIRCLDLRWSSRSSRNEHVLSDYVVLEALQPHQNLKTLKVKNFMGPELPTWLVGSLSSSIPNLVELVLSDCGKCKQLPSLGQLQHLKLLHIRGMNSVTCLGSMLYGDESNAATVVFPSLVELTLDSMENLDEWVPPPSPPQKSSSRSTSSFSCLEKLTVSFCSKLSEIPTPFPSLRELKLQSCQALKSLPDIQCLTSVWKLTIRDCKEFKLSTSDLKCLTSIAIRDIDTPISPF